MLRVGEKRRDKDSIEQKPYNSQMTAFNFIYIFSMYAIPAKQIENVVLVLFLMSINSVLIGRKIDYRNRIKL